MPIPKSIAVLKYLMFFNRASVEAILFHPFITEMNMIHYSTIQNNCMNMRNPMAMRKL